MPAPTRVVAAAAAEAAGASAGADGLAVCQRDVDGLAVCQRDVDALAVCQRDVGPRDRGLAVGAMGGLLVPGLCVGVCGCGWVGLRACVIAVNIGILEAELSASQAAAVGAPFLMPVGCNRIWTRIACARPVPCLAYHPPLATPVSIWQRFASSLSDKAMTQRSFWLSFQTKKRP